MARKRGSKPEDSPDLLDELLEESNRRDEGFSDLYEAARKRRRLLRRLAQLRHFRGLTQGQVAKRMGTKQPSIAKLEANAYDPRLSTVDRYADALGLRIEYRIVDKSGEIFWNTEGEGLVGAHDLVAARMGSTEVSSSVPSSDWSAKLFPTLQHEAEQDVLPIVFAHTEEEPPGERHGWQLIGERARVVAEVPESSKGVPLVFCMRSSAIDEGEKPELAIRKGDDIYRYKDLPGTWLIYGMAEEVTGKQDAST